MRQKKSSSPPKEKITFTCTYEVKQKLTKMAKEDRRTISNLIECLIEDFLNKK